MIACSPGRAKSWPRAGLTSNKRIVANYQQMGVALDTQNPRSRMKLTEVLEDSIVNHRVRQPATFFKLDLIRELGELREELHFTMDLDLWVRALCRSDLAMVLLTEQDVAFFREHPASKTAKQIPGFLADEARVSWGVGKQCRFSQRSFRLDS